MIGLILGLVGTFFEELNNSISKNKLKKHNHLKIGVISSFFGLSIYLIIIIYKYFFTELSIYLNPEGLHLIALRIVLEILQIYFTILAIKHSDRSTFSILRILTIPLLLIADIALGYQFSIYSYIGIGIILLSFLVFNINIKTINFKGWKYVLFTSVNAVFTLSLFKYSIDYYGNSVEVDQAIMVSSIFLFFLIYNYKENKSCALKLIIKEKQFILQGLTIGVATSLIAYSYLYLNASEATAVKRAGEMFWAIIAGTLFFKEKNIYKKLAFAFCICLGLGVMVINI